MMNPTVGPIWTQMMKKYQKSLSSPKGDGTKTKRLCPGLFSVQVILASLSKQSHRISKRAEAVTKNEIKAAVQSATDEELSIRSLMSKHESAVIITDPREYQTELFEKAKQQNTIAVLDTGRCPGELTHVMRI